MCRGNSEMMMLVCKWVVWWMRHLWLSWRCGVVANEGLISVGWRGGEHMCSVFMPWRLWETVTAEQRPSIRQSTDSPGLDRLTLLGQSWALGPDDSSWTLWLLVHSLLETAVFCWVFSKYKNLLSSLNFLWILLRILGLVLKKFKFY